MHRSRRTVAVLATCCLFGALAERAHGADEPESLLDLSIEELMNVEVTTANKSSQKLAEVPAAIFVLTQDDIRRSGASTIPDVLRLVPGLEVGQLDGNKWAVSARGFNRRFANKLLVLMDGRTLYTPLFSGVFWEIHGTVMEDIERIEVIRGPGATVWGANAVNGIVNIITKRAAATNGNLLSATVGTEDKGIVSARSGGQVSDKTYARGFVHASSRDEQYSAAADGTHDDWNLIRTGFRIDHDAGARRNVTIQGEAYQGSMGEKVTIPLTTAPYSEAIVQDNDVNGHFLMGTWRNELTPDSNVTLQAYYDHNQRVNPSVVGDDNRDIFDLDLHHTFPVGDANELHWGAGYRLITDKIAGTATMTTTPAEETAHFASGFVQDIIKLSGDGTALTLGTKYEYSDVSDDAWLPSARINVPLSSPVSVWGAASRALRSTSRVERSIRLNTTTVPPSTALNPSNSPLVSQLTGNPSVEGENMRAYELGVRVLPTSQLSINVAAYAHHFDELRTFERGQRYCAASGAAPPCAAGDYIIQLRTMDNQAHGDVYGVETDADWRATSWWRLRAVFAYVNIEVTTDASSTDTTTEAAEGRSPTHNGSLVSNIDLSRTVEFDIIVRYVDDLPADGIPAYTALDSHIAWRPTRQLELALIGRNLTDPHHPEFLPDIIATQATEVERSVSARVIWHF